MDNGNTKKGLVGRTYAGVDGYCPFAVFGRHHGQRSTAERRSRNLLVQ